MQHSLTDIIIQKIQEEGPVSFRDFMDMALYYPGLGYYNVKQNIIGKNGDFYTSSSLTPVFGASIARQLEEIWHILGEKEFTVVEYGAGNGMLCHDILDHLKNNRPLFDRLHYCIIEKSALMREKEKQLLPEKVSWYNSITDLTGFTGCVISNELIDNFPVHQVVMQDELMEVYVDHKNGFSEILLPARESIKSYLAELQVALPKGYRTEINLDALNWITQVGNSLKKGYMITIDYGYASCEFYSKYRNKGTLLCYHNHTINEDPYINIGRQDITAHVNFSALCHWGFKNRLTFCGLIDQARFLLALGLKENLCKQGKADENIAVMAMRESFLKHTLLVSMGQRFKVLIQSKAVQHKELLGLKLNNVFV